MYFSIVAYQRVTIKSSDLTGDDFVETIAQKGPDDFSDNEEYMRSLARTIGCLASPVLAALSWGEV